MFKNKKNFYLCGYCRGINDATDMADKAREFATAMGMDYSIRTETHMLMFDSGAVVEVKMRCTERVFDMLIEELRTYKEQLEKSKGNKAE